MYKKLVTCLESVRKKVDFKPEVALILGSGLGDFADGIKIEQTIDYTEIEGFPVSTVKGHKGRFVFGYVEDTPVVIMQGRVHYYEGYSMEEVVLPVRLMKKMGIEILFLTNASGGINPEFAAGDFMMIRDQIASFVPSPLRGANVNELGVRFPDMSQVYDKELQLLVKKAALGLDIDLKEGTYLQLSGPQFETPKEVAMCRTLGADAVGMSTACEAIAARHMGMRVVGISCISNLGCGMTDQPLSAEEVKETADLCCKFDFCLCLPRALEFLHRVLTGIFRLSGGFRPGGVQGYIFIPHITVVFRNQGILIIFLIGLLVIVPNSPINIRLHSTAAVAFGVPAVKGIPLSYGNIGQK